MPDLKFDKQVQQKMEELRFSPSPTVWNNLEIRLDEEKKQRKTLLWFFLLTGFCLGLCSWYAYDLISKSSISLTKQTLIHPNYSIDKRIKKSSAGKGTMPTLFSTHSPSLTPLRESERVAAVQKAPVVKKGTTKSDLSQVHSITNQNLSTTGGIQEEGVDSGSTSLMKTAGGDTSTTKAPDSAAKRIADSPTTGLTITLPFTTQDNTAVKPAGRKAVSTQKKGWQIGLLLSPGMASQQNRLFHNAKLQNLNQSYYLPASSLYYFPSSINDNPIVHPGFSLEAGLILRKSINRKLDITTGLNYHYYTSTVEANMVSVYPAAFYVTSFSISSAAYPATKSRLFRNRYHVLEWPVTIGYTLNKNIQVPVRLEAGLSVSQFLGGKVVQASYGSAYYADNNSLHKTQLSGALGLRVGFRSGRSLIEAGPQLQYGLTGLMKNGVGPTQHLFSGGLTVAVMRGKK